MRVVHVVPSINAEASGLSYSVPALCSALISADVRTSLHVLAPAPPSEAFSFELVNYPRLPIAHRLGFSAKMLRGIQAAARHADIVHNHSFWMMPNIYAGWAAESVNVPLMMSPRGVLSEWSLAHRKWRKRLVWYLAQRRAAFSAACFHATSTDELSDIRKAGFRVPIAVIPNGIDVPATSRHHAELGQRRRLLFLGRIHPQKGVDLLLHAWKRVERRFADWELHVVGPDDGGYLGQMITLASKLGVERAIFEGPAYGERKTEAYGQADLFVLPSHSENFAMTVAEALAHGVPAIVSHGAPWSGIETRCCGWWIEQREGALAEALCDAMTMSREELAARGRRGTEWMRSEFAWPRIATMMRDTYRWLLGRGARPGWVEELRP